MSLRKQQPRPSLWLVFLLLASFASHTAALGDDGQNDHLNNAKTIVQDFIKNATGEEPEIFSAMSLTDSFKTKSEWDFVIAQRENENGNEDTDDTVFTSYCFVHNGKPDCDGSVFPTFKVFDDKDKPLTLKDNPDWFEHPSAPQVVYAKDGTPLLILRTASPMAYNGNKALSVFIFRYDQSNDVFTSAFSDMTGHNNNEEIRFIDYGPLLGDVITERPSAFKRGPNPYSYDIHLYRLKNGLYKEILMYRSLTSYRDGNHLAVIDADMPEILRRLNLWKPGMPLPPPKQMPSGCGKVTLRKGIAWCE